MTQAELRVIRKEVLSKFSNYLKAEECLTGGNRPGGFIDKSTLDDFWRAKKEYHDAEVKWQKVLKLYTVEQSTRK